MLVSGPSGDVSLSLNRTPVAENTYLRVRVANGTGNTTLATGATVDLYDSATGTLVATQLVGNNDLGASQARSGTPYAEFFGLDPAKTYDVVVRYPGNDQGVTVLTGKRGLGVNGIASTALREVVDSQLTAVSPGGKDVITVAREYRATSTDGGNWAGTRYADWMVGDAGNDTFTPNGANVGEAGDTIDLSTGANNGGNDKVVFNTVLNLNTAATITGFTAGAVSGGSAVTGADTINVSGLLTALGYAGARNAASLAYTSGNATLGQLKVDPANTSDLMLRIYNGSGWQDLALIKGTGLTGQSVSTLVANGNLQLGQLALSGTSAWTFGETIANSRQALFADATLTADGNAYAQDFSKATLKVTLGDVYAEDQFSLVAGNGVTVSSGTVSYNGTAIGTVDSTFNGLGKALQVNFAFAGTSLTSAQQATAVQAVARAVQYQNTGDTPPDYYRDLTLAVSDGQSTAQMVGQLTVTPVVDSVVVSGKSLVTGTVAAETLTGTIGADTLVGYGGPVANAGNTSATGDTLTGGGGHDTFVYRKGNVGKDAITDFAVGWNGQGSNADIIDVRDLLQGFVPGTSVVNDFVRIINNGSNTQQLVIDYNGKADGSGFEPYMAIDLQNMSLASTGVSSYDALRDRLVANDQLVLSNQQVQTQAAAIAKIATYAAGGSTALGLQDYADAGVLDVTDFNLAGMNAAVRTAYGTDATVVQDVYRVQNLVYPTITGTAVQGQTLTANFIVSSGLTYQWKADGANIVGANNSTLVLSQNEVGKSITVTVANSNDPSLQFSSTVATGGNIYGLGAGNGQLLRGVSVDGSSNVFYWDRNGDGVANDLVSYSDAKAFFTKNTLNGFALLAPGATATTYGYVPATVVTGSATNTTYDGIEAVWDAFNGTTTATGTDIAPISGVPSGWNSGYYWTSASMTASSGAPLQIAFNLSLGLRNQVTLDNKFNLAVQLLPLSDNTLPAPNGVGNTNDPGQVAISGTAEAGQPLQANVSDLDGLTGAQITYQWMADGVNISGATGQTLAVTSAMADKALTVKAAYTDVFGSAEAPVSSLAVVAKVLQSGLNETVLLNTANTSHKLVGFETWNGSAGDQLDLRNLLQNYTSGSSTLSDWVSKTTSMLNGTTSTTLTVDLDGPGSASATQTVVLQGVDWGAQSIEQLRSSGVILA